jgi:RNA polymerase sigma factor (sigma-70 family)
MLTYDQNCWSAEQLVQGAREGDSGAWATITQRYAELIRSVARRYRLSSADIEDVSQLVWLKLFDHIDQIREPRALPGWIATTTANACLGVAKTQARTIPTDPVALTERSAAMSPVGAAWDPKEPTVVLQRQEDSLLLRKGLDELPTDQRNLLILLMADPPLTYKQISQELGRPIGSIGPTRARILERLRNTSAVRTLTLIDEPRHARLAA